MHRHAHDLVRVGDQDPPLLLRAFLREAHPLFDVHVRDASEHLGEVGSAELLGRLTVRGLAFGAGGLRLFGLVEDDPGRLLPRPALFLLGALTLLFAAPLFLLEKLLAQLEEAAPAVGGQVGVLR